MTWKLIYHEYCMECLDADGDFSMEFITWLEQNYRPPNKLK